MYLYFFCFLVIDLIITKNSYFFWKKFYSLLKNCGCLSNFNSKFFFIIVFGFWFFWFFGFFLVFKIFVFYLLKLEYLFRFMGVNFYGFFII